MRMDGAAEGSAPCLVTVVIPSYNHRAYIEATIESVRRQTYPAIQIVVIDDGSNDGSREFLAHLSIQWGFDFIPQSNAGVCHALNRAIRERARGEYVALLGSDDIWLPEKIELQVSRLREARDSEFCFAQALAFEGDPFAASGRPFPRRPLEGCVLGSIVFRQHVPAGTMIFSRRLFDALGGFDESLREEDWDFIIRAAGNTRFVAVRKPLLLYRQHAMNTMRVRPRRETFHQKILILGKNFPLFSPSRWLVAVVLHFLHDMVLDRIRLPGTRRRRVP